MNKLKKWLRSPAATLAGFAVAAGLLLFSTVGGARAALFPASDYYGAQVEMRDIGVTLFENGNKVSFRDFRESGDVEYGNGEFEAETGALLESVDSEDNKYIPDKISLGKKYPFVLTIKNTGKIDQYARVTIYKYWRAKGSTSKDTTISPALIHIGLDNIGSDWELDEASTTPERVVLYYKNLLTVEEESAPFTSTILIDGSLIKKVHQVKDPKNENHIITTYEYDGREFVVEATVDAVQDHHAADAIRSAWGVDGADKGINYAGE